MSAIIEMQDLVVRYKEKEALRGLSLRVQKGEIFGFLGPNGAGKSTAIKALLGLIQIARGQALLHGLAPSDIRSRITVGYLPEETTYYRFLTPVEILTFYGRLFRLPKDILKKRIETLLDLVGLSDVKHKLISTFSKGMTQKVSLAQALVNEPQTLILDEPTSGLDPLARLDLRKILNDLRAEGRTIFFSSHELSEAELVCDSIAILKDGKLVRSGPLREVLGGQKEHHLERFFLETIRREEV